MKINRNMFPFTYSRGFDIFGGQGKVAGYTNSGIVVQHRADILKDFVVPVRGFDKNLGLVEVMWEFFQTF